jgi:hypothetical protein
MKHTYCSDCGNKIEFSLKPPNFCNSCGSPLNSTAKKNTPIEEKDEEINFSEERFQKPSKLEYEISHAGTRNVSMQEIMSQGPIHENDKISRPKNLKPIDSEQIINEGIRECSSARPTEIGEK